MMAFAIFLIPSVLRERKDAALVQENVSAPPSAEGHMPLENGTIPASSGLANDTMPALSGGNSTRDHE